MAVLELRIEQAMLNSLVKAYIDEYDFRIALEYEEDGWSTANSEPATFKRTGVGKLILTAPVVISLTNGQRVERVVLNAIKKGGGAGGGEHASKVLTSSIYFQYGGSFVVNELTINLTAVVPASTTSGYSANTLNIEPEVDLEYDANLEEDKK